MYNVGFTMIWTPHTALLYARSSQRYTMEFWLVYEIMCYGFMSLVAVLFIIVLSYLHSLGPLLIIFGLVNLLTLRLPQLYRDYIIRLQSQGAYGKN